MNDQRTQVTERLNLYGLYFLQYAQPKPRQGKRTVRALFLGETRKQSDAGLSDLAPRPVETETSAKDRYLDIAFLAYRPGNGLPDSPPSSRYDVFTVYFCSPNGLAGIAEGNTIELPANFHTKQFVDRPGAPSLELLAKLRRIGEETGLIDTQLAKIGKKTPDRLTTTKIRELHRGFTRMMERAKPDSQ